MGTFRTLSAADVMELVQGFGLSGYRSHRAISAGTINTNLAVELTGGNYFLRINEGKALPDVEREARVIEHLSARGVPTPPALRGSGGEPWLSWRGLYVSLFPWVPGEVLARDAMGEAEARQAGAALAGMHLVGADFPDRRPGRYEPDEIARRFATIEARSGRDPDLHAATAEIGPELARLASARAPRLPEGLIHGDLFIDNVLFDGGRLVALLDFEQASWGRLAYDLAVSVLAFGFGTDDFRPEVTRAVNAGYAAVRTPTVEERLALPDELCFAACRFAVTRITDVHLRRADGAPPGKDYRRYLQRLRALKRQLGPAGPFF
jgi:homoserine kinase type II